MVICAPAEVAELLKRGRDEVSVEAVKALLEAGGLEPDYEPADGNRSLEGVSTNGAYVVLQIFGDDWKDLAKDLVREAVGLELYGAIHDEFFEFEFYALTADGQRYLGWMEGDETSPEDSREALERKWLSLVPPEVVAMDTDTFCVSDPEDDEI